MYISRSLQAVGIMLMFLLAALDVKSQEAAETIPIDDHLIATGETITFDPGTTIDGQVWVRYATKPKKQKRE